MFAAHSLPAVTSDITRAPELECRCRARVVDEAAERAEVEEVAAGGDGGGAKELKLLSLDPTALRSWVNIYTRR